jgi:hypothetical protein
MSIVIQFFKQNILGPQLFQLTLPRHLNHFWNSLWYGVGSSCFATYLPKTNWPYLRVRSSTVQCFPALVILQISKAPLMPETISNLLADKSGSFLWKYSKPLFSIPVLCFQMTHNKGSFHLKVWYSFVANCILGNIRAFLSIACKTKNTYN